MKDKYFFISGYHKLVYVHEENEEGYMLGGLSTFVNDAKSNNQRQFITKEKFNELKTMEVDYYNKHSYPFLEIEKRLEQPHWRVTKIPSSGIDYIRSATKIK